MEKISLFFIVEIIPFPLTWGKGQRVLKNEKNLGIIEGISVMLGLASNALSDHSHVNQSPSQRRLGDEETPKPGGTTRNAYLKKGLEKVWGFHCMADSNTYFTLSPLQTYNVNWKKNKCGSKE